MYFRVAHEIARILCALRHARTCTSSAANHCTNDDHEKTTDPNIRPVIRINLREHASRIGTRKASLMEVGSVHAVDRCWLMGACMYTVHSGFQRKRMVCRWAASSHRCRSIRP